MPFRRTDACTRWGLLLATLLALHLGTAPRAFAQTPSVRFDHLTVDEGLAQNTVTSITRDPYGFLWIGTEGGLNRYDGYSLLTFRHDAADSTSLPHSIVHDLLVARDGTLWVGTYGGGLARLDAATGAFVAYRHEPDDPRSLSHDRVLTVVQDDDGLLWIGTEGGGLNRFDPATGTFTRYRHDPDDPRSLSHDEVRTIIPNADGTLWIGTTGGGLNRLDPSTGAFTRFRHDPDDAGSLPSDFLQHVHRTRDGLLWIGTREEGLCRFDPADRECTTFRARRHDPGALSSDRIQWIHEDGDGVLWVATDSGGLNRYDPATGTFTPIRHDPARPASLSSNRTRVLYEDDTGLLWIGTWDRGLSKRRPLRFDLFEHDPDDPHSLSAASIGAFAEAPDGSLWIGTFGDGLNRYDPGTGRFDRFRHDPDDPHSITHDLARAVYVDDDGFVWTGTTGHGLDRYDPRTGRFEHFQNEYNSVVQLYEDRRGQLWAATFGGGPCRVDTGTGTLSCLSDELREGSRLGNLNSYRIHEDRDGRYWISAWGAGVDVYDPLTTRIVSYRNDPEDASTLSQNHVLSIHEDRQGRIWLGTYGGGLNRFVPETGTFARITERDGLPNNIVYGILEDDQGFLWLSTNRGLARFDPEAGTFSTYDARDGLQSNEFNGGSFLRLRSGEMVFGGVGGFNRFHPARVDANRASPPVRLSALNVYEQPLLPAQAVPALDAVRLNYRQNFLSFEFSALDLAAPAKNTYAYRLEGVDTEWIASGHRRYVSYPNLAPGQYVLRVRGTNSDGMWSDRELELPVTIVPPFWMTTWFRVMGVLFAAVVMAGAVRYVSTRRLRAEVQRLETERRLQQERERISRDLHDHVGSQLSTIISGLELVNLSSQHGRQEEVERHLQTLDEDARLTMTQLRETIWALHHEEVTLESFTEQLRRFARRQVRYRQRPAVRCHLAGAPEHVLTPLHALNLFRIAQEAIHNALKHADADLIDVEVSVSETPDGQPHLVLRVHDDGCFTERRAPVEHAATDALEGGDGSPGMAVATGDAAPGGYGLGGMRKRSEELGGRFHLETGSDGTTIVVEVPV